MLRDLVDKTFKCTWLPMGPMSLVLGAHTGRSMVGLTTTMLSSPGSISEAQVARSTSRLTTPSALMLL